MTSLKSQEALMVEKRFCSCFLGIHVSVRTLLKNLRQGEEGTKCETRVIN